MKKIVLALTLFCLTGACVRAQETPGAGFAVTVMSRPDFRMVVLRRMEVQNHLRLTLLQKQALAEMLSDPSRAAVRFNIRSEGPPDQKRLEENLKQQVEEHQKGIQDQLAQILRPEQMVRLSELSLQWRGAMALNDPKVAEQIGLKAEQRAQVARIVAEYQQERSRVFQSLMKKSEMSSPDGAAKRVMVQLNLSELDKPLSPARRALEDARDRAEKQIMELLTETQRKGWRQAQGESFTFKAENQSERF